MKKDCIKPNQTELQILNLGYKRFFTIFDEFLNDSFWELSPEQRLMKLKICFETYTELSKYEPIKLYIQFLKNSRPPEEALLAEKYFSFIRNVLSHFPFFVSWNDVYITNDLVCWDKPKNSSVQKFLETYKNKESIKFRVWNEKKRTMTYMDIKFPDDTQKQIYLKDLISEKEGMLLCMMLMKKVLDSQLLQE
ncbi:MAG: hypothetical protein IJL05_00835 [Alphaproteobacteria bacterium]|nr:hypothetical protein [Alphaproteobacteria bacterium]